MGLWATTHSCLSDLTASKYVDNFELIVVSNGGDISREEAEIIRHLENLKEFKHIHEDAALTPPAARTRGVVESSGEILCFLDNHCLVKPQYFDRFSLDFGKGMDMVHSSTCFHESDGVHYQYRLKLDYNFWAESVKTAKDDRPYMIAAGGHGGFAVRRSVWDAVGGYGPDDLFIGYGGEELVFDLKLWRMGYKVHLDPKAIHYHYAGHRGYDRHFTDDYYTNLLVCANVIGGEKWFYKVFDSFISKVHMRLKPKKHWFDILEEAYVRSAEYAQHLDNSCTQSLDDVLRWFRLNGVRA